MGDSNLMNREQLLHLHSTMAAHSKMLMKAKNHDYSGKSGDDPFANFRRCESMGVCLTETGVLVRMIDKLSRLATFVDAGELKVKGKGDSVLDTLLDLINYCVLLAGIMKLQPDTLTKEAYSDIMGIDLEDPLEHYVPNQDEIKAAQDAINQGDGIA